MSDNDWHNVAMARNHSYQCSTKWTGAGSAGTANYRSYDRSHVSGVPGRPDLLGSSDPAFRGDPSRWNPELLLVAALSQCHLLQYLHLCAVNGVTVVAYRDDASGTMEEDGEGGGKFTEEAMKHLAEASWWSSSARSTMSGDATVTTGRSSTAVNRPPPSPSSAIVPEESS